MQKLSLSALPHLVLPAVLAAVCQPLTSAAGLADQIGREVSVPTHLRDGDEYTLPVRELVRQGEELFLANWTKEEGGGRPLAKGTGAALSDPTDPLVFPRNFNRLSGPDANSCAGCHNAPFGIPGGNGDIVGNVFVLGQRFDFITMDGTNTIPTKSTVNEQGELVNVQSFANSRATLGMFGSGFIEMLARQMTHDLRTIRDSTAPGMSQALVTKGISFGQISRHADGTWDTSGVEGLPAVSLTTTGAEDPPNLIVRPFHQAGRVVSLREFSNNAFVQHHGIETTERFGLGTDPDGDGYTNEMTRADMTAVSVYQAVLSVPGRVIPNDPAVEEAVLTGEGEFEAIGCAACHTPNLPLDDQGWIYTEPNPYNPPGNLRPGDAPVYSVDLTSNELPPPRLRTNQTGVVYVPAFTDLKLHDICAGPDDPNIEPLDMQQAAGSMGFFAGNRKFITRKLWDVANKPNHFHHGLYTTMREAILAHAGEALPSRQAFAALSAHERDSIIEFLKTLRVLPPGTAFPIVDENGQPKAWPPARFSGITRRGNTITISWAGSSGLYQVERLYQLQKTSQLTGAWEDVGNPTTATIFTNQTANPFEFFRLKVLSQ